MKRIVVAVFGAGALLFAAVFSINIWEKAARESCRQNDGAVSDDICAVVVEKCRRKGCNGRPPTEGFWAAYFGFMHGIGRG